MKHITEIPFMTPSMTQLPKIGDQAFLCQEKFPITAKAVAEVKDNIQAPYSLALMAALTTQSIAIQGLVDVETNYGKKCPVSIMALAIADSGERKTAVENAFLDPVRKYQRESKSNHKEMLDIWKITDDLWKDKLKECQQKIKKSQPTGKDDSDLVLELRQILAERPERPREMKIIYDNTTIPALLHRMYEDSKYAALVSSEGGTLLKGHAFKDFPLINNLWSGSDCVVDRKNSDSYEIVGGRLTISLMTQPSALKSFLEEKGEESRGSGLWARFLCFAPRSTQGFRFKYGIEPEWVSINLFKERTFELLHETNIFLESGLDERKTVSFDSEANNLFTAISNSIESEIRDGGRFEGLNDHASKLAENIARVAALLHCFEYGFESKIDAATLSEALKICMEASDYFSSIFNKLPQVVRDADELFIWLEKHRLKGLRYIRKNELLQAGPSCVRKVNRLNAALERLQWANRIGTLKQGKTTFVDLYPWLHQQTHNTPYNNFEDLYNFDV